MPQKGNSPTVSFVTKVVEGNESDGTEVESPDYLTKLNQDVNLEDDVAHADATDKVLRDFKIISTQEVNALAAFEKIVLFRIVDTPVARHAFAGACLEPPIQSNVREEDTDGCIKAEPTVSAKTLYFPDVADKSIQSSNSAAGPSCSTDTQDSEDRIITGCSCYERLRIADSNARTRSSAIQLSNSSRSVRVSNSNRMQPGSKKCKSSSNSNRTRTDAWKRYQSQSNSSSRISISQPLLIDDLLSTALSFEHSAKKDAQSISCITGMHRKKGATSTAEHLRDIASSLIDSTEILINVQPADESMRKLQPADERMPKLQPADEIIPKLHPADERMPKLQAADEIMPKLQAADERMPKLKAADERMPKVHNSSLATPRDVHKEWEQSRPQPLNSVCVNLQTTICSEGVVVPDLFLSKKQPGKSPLKSNRNTPYRVCRQ